MKSKMDLQLILNLNFITVLKNTKSLVKSYFMRYANVYNTLKSSNFVDLRHHCLC